MDSAHLMVVARAKSRKGATRLPMFLNQISFAASQVRADQSAPRSGSRNRSVNVCGAV
jgi:hypothetical protein